jgi:serine/threonine protein kinase
METDLYTLPEYYFIKKANRFIPKSLLKEITPDKDSHLLVNKKESKIYLINESIKRFLEMFFRPNSLLFVAQNIETGILPDGQIHERIKEFFNQMVYRNVLVAVNSQSNKKEQSGIIDLPDFKIIRILQKREGVLTALAKDKENDKEVIIKHLIFQPNNLKTKKIILFQQEFDIMNKIGTHPLIRSLLSFDKNKNLAVLEFIKGRTLDDLINIGKLKIKHKLYIAYQIIESLSIIHAKNIIHGDIHLKQFLVDPNLNIKLIDFGMSAFYSGLDNSILSPHIKGGVNHFIEPENISDNAFVNIKYYISDFYVDVYRLGIVIYFLFYEKFPFDSISWKHLYNSICKEEPVYEYCIKEEEIPSFIITIMKKSLHKNPAMRFKSAIEILNFFDNSYSDIIIDNKDKLQSI